MLVRVTDMVHTMFGDAKLTLSDPTGRITGTVHRAALAAEPLLTKGAVLLLQKVTLTPTRDCFRVQTPPGTGKRRRRGGSASHERAWLT